MRSHAQASCSQDPGGPRLAALAAFWRPARASLEALDGPCWQPVAALAAFWRPCQRC
eukprot:gene8841-biopygen769